MLRRTLLKLFTISPLAILATFKQIYSIHTVHQEGSTVFTANPQNYRDRLPDLWSEHRSLVETMADHCLATASSRDTRGWTLKQWNEELDEPKWQWQLEKIRRTHAQKNST